MKKQSSMKIPLLITLITVYLVTNIQCIQPQNQHQPTSYATSNIHTQYRQIDNYIKSNVIPQQQPQQQPQTNQEPNLFQNIDNSPYQHAPNSEIYYQATNNAQINAQNNYNNQQPQLFYVKVDKSLSQVQGERQISPEGNEHYSLQQNRNILVNSVPSAQYSRGVEAGEEAHYPDQIQQNLGSQTTQAQTDLIPAQQQTIPVEQYQQYTVQNQPEAAPNPVVYQSQPEQISQHQQYQESPQNIPPQYNYDNLQEKPSQPINYPAYQQVLVNNESPTQAKQSSGYKVRETPVERQTEEFSPTNNAFAGHQVVRNSHLFHDLAVHGSFSPNENLFEQLNYPNHQIGRTQQVQQLSQNTYDVFSDSIQGQQNMGLSAYSSADGTPQQRLLNSGL